VALGTFGLIFAEYQGLELVVTFLAKIFKNGHQGSFDYFASWLRTRLQSGWLFDVLN
jgi:hypothetical protein